MVMQTTYSGCLPVVMPVESHIPKLSALNHLHIP